MTGGEAAEIVLADTSVLLNLAILRRVDLMAASEEVRFGSARVPVVAQKRSPIRRIQNILARERNRPFPGSQNAFSGDPSNNDSSWGYYASDVSH